MKKTNEPIKINNRLIKIVGNKWWKSWRGCSFGRAQPRNHLQANPRAIWHRSFQDKCKWPQNAKDKRDKNNSKTPVSFVIQLIYYLLCVWSLYHCHCERLSYVWVYLFQVSGEYIVCFSNQFSTFSHKTVFFSLVAGEEKSIIPSGNDLIGPITFIEAASDEIHKSLHAIIDTQTHYRLVSVA